MLAVPAAIGTLLSAIGFGGLPRLVVVLQAAMPPAFATLVLGETYNLDRQLTVTAIALGAIVLLFALPLWIGLFGPHGDSKPAGLGFQGLKFTCLYICNA